MAVDYKQYSSDTLKKMAAANSSDWHSAGTQQERDALHQANVEINRVLDSRNGTSTTYDGRTGTWSTSGRKTTGGSGSSGSSASTGGSGWEGTDFYAQAIEAAKQYAMDAAGGGQGNWAAVLAALDNRDRKIAATGMDYGKSSQDILRELQQLYYTPYQQTALQPVKPSQDMEWDSVSNQLAHEAINMKYDNWLDSDQYRALAERYGLQGKMSMQDVLGQISSRTGGLASSYAATAAQQQYNQYMSQLEDAARQMYAGERSDLLENLRLAQDRADTEYQRYLDELSQYNLDRNFNYQAGRDQVSDSRYTEELEYSRGQEGQQMARDQVDAILAAGGTPSGELIAAAGYSDEYVQALRNAWMREQASSTGSGSRSSGGGSSRSGTGSGGGGTGSWSDVEDWVSRYGEDAAEDYIREHYKALGYSSVSAALAGWKNHQRSAGGSAEYQNILNQINHINPGTNVNIPLVFSEKIQKAFDSKAITEDEMVQLLSKLGY